MKGSVPHLLHVFSTFVPAGPELRTVRLINALGEQYRHSILAIDGRTDAREELAEGVDARVLDSLPRAGTPRTVARLRRLYRDLSPNLLLTYNWGAMDAVIAARSQGRRAVVHHEDGFNADEAKRFKRRRVWTRRLLLPGVRRVVVPSTRLETIAREQWKLPAEKVRCVPNGIDLSGFEAEGPGRELRAEQGIPPAAFVLGFVGHLRPVKAPRRFLDACGPLARALDLHFLVLGEGEEAEPLRVLARETGVEDRLHLVGHRSDLGPWYRAMDAFVISSDSEQMPVALVEAMASGLPVVSTDVGDVRRMLPEAQGEYVIPLDRGTAALRGAVRALVELDADERARLGAGNRARAEEDYAFATMLLCHQELWEDALGGGQ